MTQPRLLAGFHAISARLRASPASITQLQADTQRRDPRMQQLLARAKSAGVRIVEANVRQLDALSMDTPHQGVVAFCEATAQPVTLDDVLMNLSADELVLMLDGVTDPRNLGACLRTAEAAGASAVIVPRDRSAALTPAAAKAAAGAAETLPLLQVTNLARTIDEMKDAGMRVIGAAGEAGQIVFDVDLRGPIAWVLGEEGHGLRRLTRERCDVLAAIPLAQGVESLNVSVATGICLFETVRQRRSKPT